jgi:hypothetical protein
MVRDTLPLALIAPLKCHTLFLEVLEIFFAPPLEFLLLPALEFFMQRIRLLESARPDQVLLALAQVEQIRRKPSPLRRKRIRHAAVVCIYVSRGGIRHALLSRGAALPNRAPIIVPLPLKFAVSVSFTVELRLVDIHFF